MAFLFGLLHGLGFAGALAETGVPADQIPLALVAFNLGVEAGQLTIVATLVVAATALRRVLAPARALRWLPPYVMGTLAVAWVIARVLAFWRPPA